MSMVDKILAFIGTKWFSLILGILMSVLLLFTYHNFQVVFEAGEMSKYWWIVAVFVINIFAVIMSFYKFMSLWQKQKNKPPKEW